MDFEHARLWLLLARAPRLDIGRLSQNLDQSGLASGEFDSSHIQALLGCSDSKLRGLGLSEKAAQYLLKPDWEQIKQDYDWFDNPDKHLVAISDDAYPVLLRDLPDPPLVLFAYGKLELLNFPQLAIVGSRNPTPAGLRNARDFSSAIAGGGIAVTSGLALGIDGASHQAALDVGGATIAVTGTGLDRIYPSRNQALARQIAEEGVLISEFALGTPALPANFPRRNRIISGMTLGCLVVEAAVKSGSLITARLAMEYGREVFAIPGSIHNPLARGCHKLLKQGAKLIETAAEILEELDTLGHLQLEKVTAQSQIEEQAELDQDYQQLLDLIDYDITTVDDLVERSKLKVEVVSNMLLILELQDLVVSVPGGYARI